MGFFGAPGLTELMIVGGIILLLFGGNKLPQLMRGLGQGITEFKKGVRGIEDEIEDASKKPVKSSKSDD
jgi:sec-independent protein translocase protein TatA